MKGLTVASVPVLHHPEPVELDRVAVLQRARGFGQRGVRQRRAPLPTRAEPALFHVVVVAEQPAGLPRHVGEQAVEEGVGACHPTPSHVDPRAVAEVEPFDRDVAVHVDHLGH